ncbi:MAG: ATP-binding protein [Phycisphaerae bacterium]
MAQPIIVEQLSGRHDSKPANPLIAGAVHRTGAAEVWGRGTSRVIALCKQNGVAAPVSPASTINPRECRIDAEHKPTCLLTRNEAVCKNADGGRMCGSTSGGPYSGRQNGCGERKRVLPQ